MSDLHAFSANMAGTSVGSWEHDVTEALERMLENHLQHTATKRLDVLLTQHARPYALESFSFFYAWTMPPDP